MSTTLYSLAIVPQGIHTSKKRTDRCLQLQAQNLKSHQNKTDAIQLRGLQLEAKGVNNGHQSKVNVHVYRCHVEVNMDCMPDSRIRLFYICDIHSQRPCLNGGHFNCEQNL